MGDDDAEDGTAHRIDGICSRDQALSGFHMQVLDNPAIDDGDALAPGDGLVESGDLTRGAVDLSGIGREHSVGDADLRRMDHRLAVKPIALPCSQARRSPISSLKAL